MGKRSNGEGSVVKRKDGRWCAAYTLNGKRHYMYGKTRKEVVAKLRETLTESDGAYYPDISVEDYLTRWLETSVKASVRARTYERYESVCRVLIISHVGDKRLVYHTQMDVQSLYRERLGSGCSQEPSGTSTLPSTKPSSRPSGGGSCGIYYLKPPKAACPPQASFIPS